MYVCDFAIFRQADPVQLKQWQDQTTTPGTTFPTLCKKSVGSLMPLLTSIEYMQKTGPTFIVHIWEDKNVLLFADISVKAAHCLQLF